MSKETITITLNNISRYEDREQYKYYNQVILTTSKDSKDKYLTVDRVTIILNDGHVFENGLDFISTDKNGYFLKYKDGSLLVDKTAINTLEKLTLELLIRLAPSSRI